MLKIPFKGEHDCEWRVLATELSSQLDDMKVRAAFEDPDTGLGNRRQFERDIIRLTARQQRDGTPFCIAIVEARHLIDDATKLDEADIDDLSREFLDTLRLEDHISRLNAFQFGIVLEGAETAGARAFAERLCQRISSSPLARPGGVRYINMSAGVAESTGDTHGVRSLVTAAEADLRRFKARIAAQRDRYASRAS